MRVNADSAHPDQPFFATAASTMGRIRRDVLQRLLEQDFSNRAAARDFGIKLLGVGAFHVVAAVSFERVALHEMFGGENELIEVADHAAAKGSPTVDAMLRLFEAHVRAKITELADSK